jgi:hypothetical protein
MLSVIRMAEKTFPRRWVSSKKIGDWCGSFTNGMTSSPVALFSAGRHVRAADTAPAGAGMFNSDFFRGKVPV